jgi:glutamate-5-semialdehyde dehydrogenase
MRADVVAGLRAWRDAAGGRDELVRTVLDAPSRAAGRALFSDIRLALAVVRGSGSAVAQLGALARQSVSP